MRKTWTPISRTSWIASSRVATKHRRSAGHIFRRRMARDGRSASRPSRTRWRSEQSSWCWKSCVSRTFFPAHSASDPVARLIRHYSLYVRASWVRGCVGRLISTSRNTSTRYRTPQLRDFLDQRVTDGVIRRIIDKWLSAGVLEDGLLRHATKGSPQGVVISPCLSNIFLHHVLDEWFEHEVRPRLKGRSTLVRFADDAVLAFEDVLDAKRVLGVLGKRFARFGLKLHPDKTRFVDFRPTPSQGTAHPETDGTSFTFLGFAHIWGKSRAGKNVVRQVTAKSRYARALAAIGEWCRTNRHQPIPDQHAHLSEVMRGHYAYYGITGNSRRLSWYAYQVARTWHKWLSRRDRQRRFQWDWFNAILKRHRLPAVRIVHRYTTASEALP